MSQTDIVKDSEANLWWRRNKDKLPPEHDPVLQLIEDNELRPDTVLEIGCANGWRLNELHKRYGSTAVGVDVSLEALADGQKRFPHIRTYYAEAGSLRVVEPYQFDMVIYGFCLYLADRADLFRIVAEGDKVLKDGGHLIIYDFFRTPGHPQTVLYHHDERLRTYKMHYPWLWESNPTYTRVNAIYDGEVAAYLLKKDMGVWK